MTQPVRTGPGDWPLETAGCKGWADFDEAIQTLATAVAIEVLWALSGRRFGLSTVAVRPCRRTDEYDLWRVEPYLPLTLPYGSLATMWCGCTRWGCSCTSLSEVSLPGPVHAVDEVRVDGVLVPAAGYVVHDHRWLVRVDGQQWPDCQDLTAADDKPGAFAVTYKRGVPVSPGGKLAAGQYACEVAKACVNDNTCRLPRGVQSVVRQGVAKTFVDPAQLAKDGMTGLPEVDQWLRAVNPHKLPRDSVVWSPDLVRGRKRTS